jgi:hypothetical protein
MRANRQEFDHEFILRTKTNLEQYRGDYEVTQLINCMTGMLIIPKETYYNEISDNIIELELLNQLKSNVSQYTQSKPLNLQYIVNKMRNAVSHGHIEFEAIKSYKSGLELEIISVKFKDELKKADMNNQKQYTNDLYDFEMSVDISLLRRFLIAFADAMITIIQQQKVK